MRLGSRVIAGSWPAGGGLWVCGALIVTMVPSSLHAQGTRVEEISQKQEEKAAAAKPYEPSRFETIMTRIEEDYVSPPSGWVPNFGSVYGGGGFTLGAGYRWFYGRDSVFDVKGLYSIRHYKQVEIGARTPWNLQGRWSFAARAGWRDAPQIGYFGLGPDSSSDARANFRIKQTYVGGTATVHPSSWSVLAADVALEDYQTEEGSGAAPSIETIYDPTTAPGLFSSPTFIHSSVRAGIDWRTSAGYSRKGGYYGVTLVDYTDTDDTFSFQRLDGEIVQHLPILRETWVLSFRGRVQTTLDGDDLVPYYLMPELGSGRTLRGYSTGRFRDRHSLLTSAEFRWIPNRLAMDMALFYDAGKVASRRDDLDFNDLKSDWGIGVRFHGPSVTVLRIEMARGSEGWNLVFASSAAF